MCRAPFRVTTSKTAWLFSIKRVKESEVVKSDHSANFATETGCPVIPFEELAGIRDRLPGASWGHTWAFERLYESVDYKAELPGITVVQVAPRTRRGGVPTVGSLTVPESSIYKYLPV